VESAWATSCRHASLSVRARRAQSDVPEIEGEAWITGEHTLVLADDDPLRYGFRRRAKALRHGPAPFATGLVPCAGAEVIHERLHERRDGVLLRNDRHGMPSPSAASAVTGPMQATTVVRKNRRSGPRRDSSRSSSRSMRP